MSANIAKQTGVTFPKTALIKRDAIPSDLISNNLNKEIPIKLIKLITLPCLIDF